MIFPFKEDYWSLPRDPSSNQFLKDIFKYDMIQYINWYPFTFYTEQNTKDMCVLQNLQSLGTQIPKWKEA